RPLISQLIRTTRRSCLPAYGARVRSFRTVNNSGEVSGSDEGFLFPWHGRKKRIDPTKPMTSSRSAWRSIRKAAGLKTVRFHDGRHTAITTLAEKGLPDWVIQAQVGHVAPEMMKTYSHIRRQALNQAAAALEPTAATTPAPPETPTAATPRRHTKRVTSQSTSQFADRGG